MREWHHVASALHYNAIAVFQGQDLLFQGHRKVWKSEGTLVMCGHNLALDVDRVNWAANIWGFHGAPEATLPGTSGSDRPEFTLRVDLLNKSSLVTICSVETLSCSYYVICNDPSLVHVINWRFYRSFCRISWLGTLNLSNKREAWLNGNCMYMLQQALQT